MSSDDPHRVTTSQRLARFGLAERESQLKNLNVRGGAEVHLDPQDRRYTEHIAVLRPQSASDLKRWLGVPIGAIGQALPAPAHTAGFVSTAEPSSFLPYPAVPLEDPEMQANLMAYLLNTKTTAEPTPTERRLVAHLDATISGLSIAVAIYLAADIHVEEGATLVVNKKISTLFANHIILEDGASIRMQSPVSQIDCARMRFVHS